MFDPPTHLYTTLEPLGPVMCGACWPPEDSFGEECELSPDDIIDEDARCEVCGRRDGRVLEIKETSNAD